MESIHTGLLLHSEVRWLSRGRSLTRLFELRREVEVYLHEEKHPYFDIISDEFWLAKLGYLASIFERVNHLNTSLQGKKRDIFSSFAKVKAFKLKIPIWKKNVAANNFCDFNHLDVFMKICG